MYTQVFQLKKRKVLGINNCTYPFCYFRRISVLGRCDVTKSYASGELFRAGRALEHQCANALPEINAPHTAGTGEG